MYQAALDQLQAAQQSLSPQLKALSAASAALKTAAKLAAARQPEALAMQKALAKLQQAAADVATLDVGSSGGQTVGNTESAAALAAATAAFAVATDQALEGLAFDFARDVKTALEDRGYAVAGKPPALVVDPLVLQLDVGARRAQWFYGKEALTRPLPLSPAVIVQAHEQQRKAIAERSVDTAAFLAELHGAWTKLMDSRSRRPTGGRLNLVETYSQLVMNRQSARFWNAPSRATFKDYERPLFVRDLVQARVAPSLVVDGQEHRLRLGTATKSQADNAGRSIWLPSGPLDGEYYSDLTFDGE